MYIYFKHHTRKVQCSTPNNGLEIVHIIVLFYVMLSL